MSQTDPKTIYTIRLRPETVALLRSKVPPAKVRQAIELAVEESRVDKKRKTVLVHK